MGWLERIAQSVRQEDPDRDLASLLPVVRLGRITLLMGEYQKRVLKPFGLTPSDYSILGALRRAGQPQQLVPGDLYNVVGCSPGGLTKMIDRLEKRGLVQRATDREDGRRAPIRLTRKGEALEREAFSAYLESADRLMAPLGNDELDQLDAALALALERFESADSEPQGEEASGWQRADIVAGAAR